MAATIRIKISQVTATPATLQAGELAYSELSNTLFVGLTDGSVLALAGSNLFALKSYVDALIAGGVHYRGTADASAATVNAATGTTTHVAGDQYRVTVAGSLAFGFQLNVGDFVIYNGSAWQKIDSTDPAVAGTTNRIAVTGSADAGWTVDIHASYAGQTSITTLGTVTTGTIDGGTF